MSQYQVVARKYRPQTFKEVLGQEPIVKTLKNALRSETLAHAYLFSGSRGTGKTTLARILAKALNCKNRTEDLEPCNSCASCQEITSGASLDVMEIDGASHRGIDDIKQIAESVGYCPSSGQWKVYLIDEVHMLTKEAFNALLKTLEEPPPNVKFFFATTEAHKIPATILSRCQRFNLARIPQDAMMAKLHRIAHDMNVTVDDKALYRLTSFAEGGLRDAESLFDQMIAFSQGNITEKVVQHVLGVLPREHFFSLDQAVLSGDMKVAFELAHALFTQGKEISHFLEDLNGHYKSILLAKLACSELLTTLPPEYLQAIQATAQNYTQDQCIMILDMIQETAERLKTAISAHMTLEALLMRIVRIRQKVPLEAIVRRLIQLEDKVVAYKEPVQPLPTSTPTTKSTPTPSAVPPPVKAPAPLPNPPIPSQTVSARETVGEAVRADDIQTNAHLDTLVQFAAVELDGTVQRKRRK